MANNILSNVSLACFRGRMDNEQTAPPPPPPPERLRDQLNYEYNDNDTITAHGRNYMRSVDFEMVLRIRNCYITVHLFPSVLKLEIILKAIITSFYNIFYNTNKTNPDFNKAVTYFVLAVWTNVIINGKCINFD